MTLHRELRGVSRRPGLCDFVPEEGRAKDFVARFHPEVRKVATQMRKFGLETLLDNHRLLSLMELGKYAAENADGELIELGVYKGGSAAAVACVLCRAGLQRPFHLCDSFAGLPASQAWEFHQKGDFGDTDCEAVLRRLGAFLPGFPFDVHRGLFSETLPKLSEKSFCLAHVDVDLYESVREACAFLYPRMARGGIIVFDDYGAPTCPGATRAVDEFFADKREKPSHIAKSAYGVRIGSEHTDFRGLLLEKTMFRAGLAALRRAPRNGAAAIARKAGARSTSPRTTRSLGEVAFWLAGRRAGHPEPELSRARSILVVRLDEIGDLILTAPFLRELRRNAPEARITLVVKPATRNLVEFCPYVNEVLAFDWLAPGRLSRFRLHARALALARSNLWPRRFELAILPRWDADYYHATFVAYFSGAPLRIGYSERVNAQKRRLNAGFDRLLTQALDDRTTKHEVERNLDVLRFLGCVVEDDRLELWLKEEDSAYAEKTLTSQGVHTGDLLFALAPGAGAAKRCWPLERWVQLGHRLLKELHARFVLVGGEGERELGAHLANELGRSVINLMGRATLRQTAAVLQRCQLTISNDAGPMHIAAAAGNAVVEICCHPQGGAPEHANSPARFGPWRVPHVVLQPDQGTEPCQEACEAEDAHCILRVDVECVRRAVRTLAANRLAHPALNLKVSDAG